MPLDVRLSRCNTHFAGILVSGAQQPAIFDLLGMDVLSVQLLLIEGTWTTTVAKVRWSSGRGGPFADYSTAVSLTTSARGSGLLAVEARYAAIEVTTAEGSDVFLDAIVHARAGGISNAVVI